MKNTRASDQAFISSLMYACPNNAKGEKGIRQLQNRIIVTKGYSYKIACASLTLTVTVIDYLKVITQTSKANFALNKHIIKMYYVVNIVSNLLAVICGSDTIECETPPSRVSHCA